MAISREEYDKFHPNVLQPLNMKIDVELFEEQMHEYRYAFRRWGVNHTEYPRYGAPLVNLNGDMFNNPEPICYPLDQWNADKPDEERIYDPIRIVQEESTNRHNENLMAMDDKIRDYVVGVVTGKIIHKSMTEAEVLEDEK